MGAQFQIRASPLVFESENVPIQADQLMAEGLDIIGGLCTERQHPHLGPIVGRETETLGPLVELLGWRGVFSR